MSTPIVMGSGSEAPGRIDGCGHVIEALRPAVVRLAAYMPAVQLLDGLLSVYLNVALALGAQN